jgi:hypothetical protein
MLEGNLANAKPTEKMQQRKIAESEGARDDDRERDQKI